MKHETLRQLLLSVSLAAALVLAMLNFLLSCLALNLYISLGIAAVLFFLGRLWRPQRAVPLCIPAFGLCLVAAIRLDRRGGDTTVSGFCALLVLLGYLLSMHGQGLHEGLHNMPGEPAMDWPRGVREKNALLVLMFLSFALGLALLPGVERGAYRLVHSAAAWVETAAGDAAARFKKRALVPPTPPSGGKPRPSSTPEPEPEAEETPETPEAHVQPEEPEELTLPVWGFLFIPAVLSCAPVYLLFRGRRSRETGQDPKLYEEEREKLRDWRSLLASARKRLRSPPRRKMKNRRRFRDFPDDRARVRYAWRILQASPAGRSRGPSLTPRELGAALGAEAYRALAEQYNLARYAPGKPLDPHAGDLAAAAMRDIRRRREKELPPKAPRKRNTSMKKEANP